MWVYQLNSVIGTEFCFILPGELFLLIILFSSQGDEQRNYETQRTDTRSQPYEYQTTPSAVPINYHGSVTIQRDNTYLTQPGTTNLYGSITRQSNNVFESDNVQDLSRDEYIKMQLGGSEPRSYQKSNGENVVIHGGVTAQSHTKYAPRPNYPSQRSGASSQPYRLPTSQQASLQSGGSSHPTASLARESTQELKNYMRSLTEDLRREIGGLRIELQSIKHSIARVVSNQEVMNSNVNSLIYKQQAQNQARQ